MNRPLLIASILSLATGVATAEPADCRLDRVTFVDAKGGGSFVAERVAVQYIYECETGWTETFDRPQPGTESCRGPFGETLIEGSLNGSRAFAVYSVIAGVPCCVWYSYSESHPPEQLAGAKWLAHEDVPSITLEDEWYTIGEENPPWEPDRGPMGGGEFVPKLCRTD